MFGLLLTLCGSVLLAVMVAVRNKKQIEEATHVITPIFGEVSPKILDILRETYFFRTGLLYIAIGALFQIFPEFDLKISSLNIFIRLIITLVGFIIILLVSNKIINKIANHNYKRFQPFTLDSPAPNGAVVFETKP